MTTTDDIDLATSLYEADGRALTDSTIRTSDASLALELQRIEIETPFYPLTDGDSHQVAWQLQEQEDFEQVHHDANVAQRLFENDESRSRQNRGRVDRLSNVLQDIERSSPSPTSENDIMTTPDDIDFPTSPYEADGTALTDSTIRKSDAALALELQMLEIETPLSPVTDGNSQQVAWQLQEQEDFEQVHHVAHVAQRLFENDESSSRQNRGRVDRLSNVLQYIERSSPSPTSEMDLSRSVCDPSMMSRNPEIRYISGHGIQHVDETDSSSDSENEDSRDRTIQMQQLAQLQHGNHGNRQQPNTEQRQQVDDTVLIPLDQQILIPNNQEQQRHHQHQLLPSVGHIRPPVFNPLQQRGPRQINQSAEIYNSTPEQRGHGRLGGLGGFGMPRQHHRGDVQVDDDINVDDYESLLELEESNGDIRNAGLTPQQIDIIPHHRFERRTNNEKDVCGICLVEYTTDERVKRLQCLHLYHKNCIDDWLKIQADCPVCRENVKIPGLTLEGD